MLVANFEVTQYPVDGRGDAEIGFEEILAFDRRGGFTIKDDSPETRRKWLARHKGKSKVAPMSRLLQDFQNC
jgi:hypothetical protein